MVMFDATYLSKVEEGPLFRRGAEAGRSFCRKNWWTNLLFINNYVGTQEPVRHELKFFEME